MCVSAKKAGVFSISGAARGKQYDSIAVFFAGVMHPNGSLQNCNAPENERFFRKKRQKAAVTLTRKVVRLLAVRRPRFAYALGRNPLLLLLSALPKGVQCAVIRAILR